MSSVYFEFMLHFAYSHLSTLLSSHRFTFTHLDAGDPSRTFSFVLNVNEEDIYDVEETSPPLHPSDLEPLLENLNDDPDNLSAFCRGMRNAFSATL